MKHAAAAILAELVNEALTCTFVADLWPEDVLASYSDRLVTTRARAFGMLSMIGSEHPDLAMTVDGEPTPADLRWDEDLAEAASRSGKTRMRVALERARELIRETANTAAAEGSYSEAAYFRESCQEAEVAIAEAMAYLRSLEQEP